MIFEKLLPRLLTNKETKLLQKRFQIIKLLQTNSTYRQIAKKMGISTTTVVRLNQRLKIRKPRPKPSVKPSASRRIGRRTREKLPWHFGKKT